MQKHVTQNRPDFIDNISIQSIIPLVCVISLQLIQESCLSKLWEPTERMKIRLHYSNGLITRGHPRGRESHHMTCKRPKMIKEEENAPTAKLHWTGRNLPSDSVYLGPTKPACRISWSTTTQAIQKFRKYALGQMDKKPTEEPFSSCYKTSRDIDAFVKTERTNGASSPGCIVVGTIV